MAVRTTSNEGYRYGRKRVALTNLTQQLSGLKTNCTGKSSLQSLPQHVLVSVLCGVNHDDLKSLYCVSKSIKEAAMIAKRLHFEYITPRKTVGFRSVAHNEELSDIEAPNAPKQSRIRRSVMSSKDLSDISVPFLPQMTKRLGRGKIL